jgi:hypothetical protein
MGNVKFIIIALGALVAVAVLVFLALGGGEVEGTRGGALKQTGSSNPLAASRLAQCKELGVTKREDLAACINSPQGVVDAISKAGR